MATKNITLFYKVGEEYRELVALSDAPALVNKCKRTLQNQMQKGKLQQVMVGRQVFFDKQDLTRRNKWK